MRHRQGRYRGRGRLRHGRGRQAAREVESIVSTVGGGPGLIVVALMVLVALVGTGSAPAGATEPSTDAMLPAHWVPSRHIPAVVDLTGPRRDGQLTLAVGGRLALLGPGGVVGFARGDHGYVTDLGTEPYIALAPVPPPGAGGRSFTRDDIFALEPGGSPAVIRIDARGQATRFAGLPRGSFPNGIAFDTTGTFGYRLLVSVAAGRATSILSIGPRGTVRTLTRRGPRVEGGMVVAPASFGIFAGDLVAPDELNGTIYAVDPRGVTRPVAESGLPHGGDIGVESEGFVPTGFSARTPAYLADRSVPGMSTPAPTTSSSSPVPGSSGPESRPATYLLPVREAPERSRCGASRPAPSPTSPPGLRLPIPRDISSSPPTCKRGR